MLQVKGVCNTLDLHKNVNLLLNITVIPNCAFETTLKMKIYSIMSSNDSLPDVRQILEYQQIVITQGAVLADILCLMLKHSMRS
jgi:hypothetical protein